MGVPVPMVETRVPPEMKVVVVVVAFHKREATQTISRRLVPVVMVSLLTSLAQPNTLLVVVAGVLI
jgi:hypothetical protein